MRLDRMEVVSQAQHCNGRGGALISPAWLLASRAGKRAPRVAGLKRLVGLLKESSH